MLQGDDFKNAFVNLSNKNEYTDNELKTMSVIMVYSMLRTFNKMSKRLIFVTVFEALKAALGDDLSILAHLQEFEFGVKIYTEVVKLYKMYFFTLGNSLIGPGRSDVLKSVGVIFLEDFYPEFLRGNVC